MSVPVEGRRAAKGRSNECLIVMTEAHNEIAPPERQSEAAEALEGEDCGQPPRQVQEDTHHWGPFLLTWRPAVKGGGRFGAWQERVVGTRSQRRHSARRVAA